MSEGSWDALVRAHEDARSDPLGRVPCHEPTAAILACSDARVPPSVIFDQPAGSLFVVRIAGNTATDAALASLDYAVDELGVGLVVVLGHSDCGAVQAAAAGTCGGHLTPIVSPICEISARHPNLDPEAIGELNVAHTLRALAEHDGPVGVAARSGRIELRGAIHDLRSGRLGHIRSGAPSVG